MLMWTKLTVVVPDMARNRAMSGRTCLDVGGWRAACSCVGARLWSLDCWFGKLLLDGVSVVNFFFWVRDAGGRF